MFCGGGGARGRVWRRYRGRAGDGNSAQHHQSRAAGFAGGDPAPSKIRRAGGGRPALTRKDPTLLEDLRRLLEPATLGDPMRPLLWVSKSHAKLAQALRDMGHRVSASRIPQWLERLGYRRQVNRKSKEGGRHPRPRRAIRAHQRASRSFSGRRPAGDLGRHQEKGTDRPIQERRQRLSAARSSRSTSTCMTSSTRNSAKPFPMASTTSAPMPVASASASITTPPNSRSTPSAAGLRRWDARDTRTCDRLMITADGGGSNGSRVRLWKVELQKFADETGLTISVCHYPPGTSKWNKIEHRLFCHITQNWRGRPLTSRSAVVELIAATTTKTGLTVRCELDANTYEKGIECQRRRNGRPQHRRRRVPSRVELHHQAPSPRSTKLKHLFRGVP